MIKIIGFVIMMTNYNGGTVEEARSEYWRNYGSPRFDSREKCVAAAKEIEGGMGTYPIVFRCVPIFEKGLK